MKPPAGGAVETRPGLIETLVRRSWLVGLGALAGLGLGYGYTTQVPPKYQSRAQVLVRKKRPDMVPGMERPGGLPDDYVATQAGIVQSPVVLGRAIQDGGLGTLKTFHGSEDLIEALLARLTVKRDLKDRTNCILDLTFKGVDPQDNQKILAAVIKSYQQFLVETYRKASDETLRLIVAARDKLEKDLIRKEAEYRAFRRTTPALFVKGKTTGNIFKEMLLTIHAKRLALRVRLAETEALLKNIEKGWKNEGGMHEELIAVLYQLPSRAVSESGGRAQSETLEEKLLQALLEERTLLAEFAPTHPRVVATRKRVEMAYKVVTSILQLERAGIQTAEKSLADLYKTQNAEAQQAVGAEVEDEVLQTDITRLRELSDSLIKQLLEVDVVKDLGGYDAEVVGPPDEGKLSLLSKPLLIIPAAALLGGMAGLGLALVIPVGRRKSFPGAAEIHERFGWPVLGRIPFARPNRTMARQGGTGGPAASLGIFAQPDSPIAEAYRGVRTALFVALEEGPRVIQVTSPGSGEGTSTVAANLAIAIAQAGKTTLLIDANLRRPSAHKRFALAAQAGLASVLAEGDKVGEVIQPSAIGGLSVLACGPLPPNPAELLSSPRFKALLGVLREQYDFVVIDTPPVLAVTDPAVVAAHVDGILVVLRVGKWLPEQVERAREFLTGAEARVLGVVLNGLKGRAARTQGYEGYPAAP